MNPVKKYEQDIKEHGFQRDPAQEQAVKSLDELFHQFQDYMNTPVPQLTRFQKLLGKKPELPTPPKGLYFWGGVGRGKTYLMDTFTKPYRPLKKCEFTFTALCIEFMMS